ncbi:MAG: hypothetical protein QM755_03015 [Luteolibacter sp.]
MASTRSPKSPRAEKGFALVSVLLFMILLTIVALGMLSLSAVQLRSASHADAKQRARANARLGLMMALGQLQTSLGADQRVCADARVVGGVAKTPAHPHWLSVWKTQQDSGTPWITRNGEKGGLADQRKTLKWDAASKRIACLVSGNESALSYTEEAAGDPADMVQLVGHGSLGKDAPDTDIVMAPRVTVAQGNQSKGGYAWWVGISAARRMSPLRMAPPARPMPSIFPRCSRRTPRGWHSERWICKTTSARVWSMNRRRRCWSRA